MKSRLPSAVFLILSLLALPVVAESRKLPATSTTPPKKVVPQPVKTAKKAPAPLATATSKAGPTVPKPSSAAAPRKPVTLKSLLTKKTPPPAVKPAPAPAALAKKAPEKKPAETAKTTAKPGKQEKVPLIPHNSSEYVDISFPPKHSGNLASARR